MIAKSLGRGSSRPSPDPTSECPMLLCEVSEGCLRYEARVGTFSGVAKQAGAAKPVVHGRVSRAGALRNIQRKCPPDTASFGRPAEGVGRWRKVLSPDAIS